MAIEPKASATGIFEADLWSGHAYPDPFNDVELDVIFEFGAHSWRVPAFWAGDRRWEVRFAPPEPGEYRCYLECSDRTNPDLNGQACLVDMSSYDGPIELLRHGHLRVSANGRHFEHADGTPFYWLGDTWWTGLSDRIGWEDFQQLTANRIEKGFTLVQLVAGLVPVEELPPLDPGFRNEGGTVWEDGFARINPAYFDFADRRIFHLLEQRMVPAIVGAWHQALALMSVAKMKQHWRYLIARYGAYPVLWVAGGEVRDPPEHLVDRFPAPTVTRGWTDVTAYIRSIDPYRHPLSVHESQPPWDTAIQDESLVDFDMIQPSHFGWPSIATEVAQLNMHYARTGVVRPVVQSEIGYEKLGETHLEDFQRTAFWLAMLNGAAGHSYGANGLWESYSADKPLHRIRWSFMNWDEGMRLPGSYQVGLGAGLLRRFPWWRFEPRPDWLAAGGTTLLEPNDEISEFEIGLGMDNRFGENAVLEAEYPGGAWRAKGGDFRRPYAAGIPREVRIIYQPPQIGFRPAAAPTIIGLEEGVRYRGFFWDPTTGTELDLGIIERPAAGERVVSVPRGNDLSPIWQDDLDISLAAGVWVARMIALGPHDVNEEDARASVVISGQWDAGLFLRGRGDGSCVAAIYSPAGRALLLLERSAGGIARILSRIEANGLAGELALRIEARGNKVIASVSDKTAVVTTPIVDATISGPGVAGILCADRQNDSIGAFELWRSSPIPDNPEAAFRTQLRDAKGTWRGDLAGGGLTLPGFEMAPWHAFGRDRHLLLDAYRPERLPAAGDWVLVLVAEPAPS